jgi:hypothetical protein
MGLPLAAARRQSEAPVMDELYNKVLTVSFHDKNHRLSS